jgi:hypothetical protein
MAELSQTTHGWRRYARTARKRLGFVKYVCLDGGHREVRYRARLRRLDRRAARLFEHLSRDGSLARPTVPAESEIELHTLCHHDALTMGIWSLYSFLRWAEGRIALFVHSDGSLTRDDAARLQEHFPKVRLVAPEEGREFVERRLVGPNYAFLRDYRAKHYLSPKVLDIHLSEGARTIVLMDTDVLFFRRPDEILSRCLGPTPGPEVTSFRDQFDWLSTVAPRAVVEGRCRTRIEPGFNSGMVVLPRWGDEQYDFFERMLRAFPPAWLDHYFVDQLLLALAAGEYGWHALPDCYRIGTSSNPDSAKAVHYVSNKAVRPSFYTEGLPRLLRSEADHEGSRGSKSS